MYKLLLVLDEKQEQFASIFAQADAFRPVRCVSDANEAISLLKSESFDAVGALPGTSAQAEIARFLKAVSSPIPFFEITDSPTLVREMRHLLNRLHMDYYDGTLSLEEMVRIVIGDLIHHLLNGSLKSPSIVPRWFNILRAPLDASLPCRVWTLSIPQREQYLDERWHHGESRLESALAQTFFGQKDYSHEYFMAFTGKTAARLIAIPHASSDSFDQTDDKISQAIEDIKEFLDLDIIVTGAETVPCLMDAALPCNEQIA